jgi:MerR family transcriptional regulator, mercuric resistance operon regulatory protein
MDGSGRIAIGRLSKHTGTNIETIRYYERVGLLPAPARTPGGYRQYGTDHLKRLNFVRRARTLGFSIGEVRTSDSRTSGGARAPKSAWSRRPT